MLNYALIVVLVCAFLYLAYFTIFYKNDKSIVYEEEEYSLDHLCQYVKDSFQKTLRVNIRELNINMTEALKVERHRKKLKRAYKECALGDPSDRIFVKDYIKNLLINDCGVSERNIDKYIDFNNITECDYTVKFLAVLGAYKKAYGNNALKEMLLRNDLDRLRVDGKESGYYVTKEDIDALVGEGINLDFLDKVDILTQLVYQRNNGNGAADELMYQNLDGVSGGESGIPEDAMDESIDSILNNTITFSYDSIWIMFQAKKIQLRFLTFGSEKELERVCKNVYQYDHPGQMSASNGYKINQMKNGSRVTVLRPNLTESWVFIIRKFDNVAAKDINTLTKNKSVSEVLIGLVKGCQVIAVTGQQSTGKTTILKSLIQYINPNFTLRIQELEFELWLRKLFYNRSIITFRETDITKGEEALEVIRKSDGGVTIFGEVVSPLVAAWLVATAHVATRMTMFTHHADSTKILVNTFRNALLTKGGFSNEMIALEEVVGALRFDIHLELLKDEKTGKFTRFVERVTEIIPMEDGSVYRLNNIVEFNYDRGGYVFRPISEGTLRSMKKNMSAEEYSRLVGVLGGGN